MSRVVVSIVTVVALALSALDAEAQARDTRLRDAVRSRNFSAVQALIKRGIDVNAIEPDGTAALHWAAHVDDDRILDALIRAGARPNVANAYGVTPLMLAAENGSAMAIQRLLRAGANSNAAMPTGETALMTAARTGQARTVTALIAGGANVNAKESMKGQTALMWALSGPHTEAARALIEHGADIQARSNSGFTPLMFAVRYNNLEAVQLLLERGAKINEPAGDGVTPLHVATLRGHVALAKFLLAHGADPSANGPGYTPLHFAVGHWEGVDAHDYVDAPGEWRVLRGLPRADKIEMIKALMAHGADPNARMTKEPPSYGFSLVAGATRQYTAGSTPFFIAAVSADPEVMRLLVSNGADPHARSKNGSTALMMAAGAAWHENETVSTEREYLPALSLCIELGVDVNAQNNSGMTALHATISGGFNALIERLVQAGADVNLKNKRGDTPLKMALSYGAAGGLHAREDTAAVLRKHGGRLE